MEKFVNLTASTKESAIKIGTNVPSGAVGLAWYSAKEILPKNNIVTVDLSETIQENRSPFIKSDNEGFMAFADELGFLRTIEGNYTFSSDEVNISNLFMNKITATEMQDISNLNPNDFVHYYYVSKKFIIAPYVFSLTSLREYVDQDSMKDLNMRVVDQNGNEYVDANTGRRKYRLLLEPFRTPVNGRRLETPYRIIVLLDASTPPFDLKLIYDKVECDDSGNTSYLELNYSETINPIPFFEEIPEEAFVIDNNYRDDRKFAVKKINQKFSDLISRQETENGYQIIAPSKAIDDYRTFEVFNWRLIARTRQSVNLTEIPELEENAAVITKTVRCAILYSSRAGETNSTASPYAFYRLFNSPFNMARFDFINPAASLDISNQSSSYWMVDIDGDTLSTYDYDIVAWAPTNRITFDQATKIRGLLSKSATVVLDLSYGPDASALNISVNRTAVRANVEEVNTGNVLLDSGKNGGWSIVPKVQGGIFEKEYYGIYGTRFSVPQNNYKTYFTINSTDANYVINEIGPNTEGLKSIATIIPFTPNTTEIVKGNIVAVTFPLLSYCNSIYSLTSSDQIVDQNVGSTVAEPGEASLYSGVVEGPFKFLYNTLAYAAYCRVSAGSTHRTNTSVFNFVSDWQSGWVMDQNALLDDEKVKYHKTIPGTDQLGIDISPAAESIAAHYKAMFADFLPEHQKDKILGINDLSAYLELFIEITNPDVQISNANGFNYSDLNSDNVSTLVMDELPSAYSLFKVTDVQKKCYAYTLKESPQLTIPENIGPYAIIEKSVSSSNQKSLVNKLNVLSSFKSYPFALQSAYSYMSGQDKPLNLQAQLNLTFNMVFKGTYKRKITSYNPPTGGTATTTLVTTTLGCEKFYSAIDSFDANNLVSSSRNSLNTFQYSGDIDIHRNAKLWDIPDVHEYVKYIQYTAAAATGRTVKVDGVYGSQTKSAVYAFQVQGGQIYLDGNVDSETKSYLAFFWKRLKKSNPTRYNSLLAWAEGNPATAVVGKYIRAAVNVGSVEDINFKTYKKITFSGFRGPSQAKDFIYFKIPDKIKKIDKIIITADDSPYWRKWYTDIFGYSATFQTDIMKTTNTAVNKSAAATGKIEINMAGIDANKARYFWFQARGQWMGGIYGYAEGFSIKKIEVVGKVAQTVTTPGTPGTATSTEETVDIWALATVSATDILNGINITGPVTKGYSTSVYPINGQITALTIGCESTGVTTSASPFPDGKMLVPTLAEPISLNPADYTGSRTNVFYDGKVSFDFTLRPVNVTLGQAAISKVTENGVTVSSSLISSSVSGNNITAQTASVFYSNNGVHLSTPLTVSGYRLRRTDGYIYPSTTNTVDVNDGVLLLCNSAGAPMGIPTSQNIATNITALTSSLLPEVDWRYGNLSVTNTLPNDEGLIYGFYDVNKKEFLGRVIPYIDYAARGQQNVFLAVCAIDADGNTQNKNEFIGPKTSSLFKPVNLPMKMIAPVYSVKMNRSTSIRVGQIDPNISKFDIWELPVTSGSFWKNVNISYTRNWTGWKADYIDQDLVAYYSTLDELGAFWSKIYGHGYYDVIDENPIILDDRTIQLRRVPLMNYLHPTSNLNSMAGIVTQQIKIYTRETIDSPWVLLSNSVIRDINSNNGIVKFITRAIPSDKNLIKVSYVTASKESLLRHIDGKPIPLNPLLNSDIIDFDSPLFIYLMPKAIYKKVEGANIQQVGAKNLSRLKEYSAGSAVNFTYNSAIFDSRSSLYDPFALPIAIIYVTNNPYKQLPEIQDIRVRGGGVSVDKTNAELQQTVLKVLSYWDVYPPQGEAYNKGGYVIIKIPAAVKDHFINEKEIYQIISNNLTAGIAYELQDMDGNTWT